MAGNYLQDSSLSPPSQRSQNDQIKEGSEKCNETLLTCLLSEENVAVFKKYCLNMIVKRQLLMEP